MARNVRRWVRASGANTAFRVSVSDAAAAPPDADRLAADAHPAVDLLFADAPRSVDARSRATWACLFFFFLKVSPPPGTTLSEKEVEKMPPSRQASLGRSRAAQSADLQRARLCLTR